MTSIIIVIAMTFIFLLLFFIIDPLSHSLLLIVFLAALLSIKIRELYLLDNIHKNITGKYKNTSTTNKENE